MPDALTAATISSASATLRAIGPWMNTCFPASAAATVGTPRTDGGVSTTIASTSSSASNSS